MLVFSYRVRALDVLVLVDVYVNGNENVDGDVNVDGRNDVHVCVHVVV